METAKTSGACIKHKYWVLLGFYFYYKLQINIKMHARLEVEKWLLGRRLIHVELPAKPMILFLLFT